MTANKTIKIAIQGIVGSYHHQVALNHFGDDANIMACDSFQKVVDALNKNQAEYGVLAIENSIAGSILPNYALIDDNHLSIVAEEYLNIKHYFMGIKGQTMHDILEVRSHPMAILQCMETLKKYPHIKIVEDKDTAQVARHIAKNNLLNIAAIASEKAAELYGLEILQSDVQTVKVNKTRFFIVSKNSLNPIEKASKASLKFILDDTKGGLAGVLNLMYNCQLNLTKIQSIPIIESPFEYAFFVDVTFEKEKHLEKAIQVLEIMTKHLKVFGKYEKFDFQNLHEPKK